MEIFILAAVLIGAVATVDISTSSKPKNKKKKV